MSHTMADGASSLAWTTIMPYHEGDRKGALRSASATEGPHHAMTQQRLNGVTTP